MMKQKAAILILTTLGLFNLCPLHAQSQWELGTQPVPPMEEIAKRPAQPLPVYGIYCWADEYLAHRAFIKQTGWRHMRLSGPITDEFMRAISEDGITLMFTIAVRRPMEKSPSEPARQWRNRANYDSDEAFIKDFTGDVTRVLDRYGPEGTLWKDNPALTFRPLQAIEVYNEPNFWYADQTKEQWEADMKKPDEQRRIKQEDARSRLYAKMLAAVYTHIKARWPSVAVVGFGAGGSGYADVRFIKAVHDADPAIGKSYDILSTHPYTHHVPPEAVAVRSWGKYSQAGSLAEIREIMAKHGAAGRPVWWTELGWGIHPEAGGKFDQANAVGGDKTVPPESHAAFYVRGYARALRLGVDRLDFMSLVDTDSFNSGMLNSDGTPRLTAKAVANMIRLMPHPKLVAVPVDGAEGVFVYRLKSDAAKPDSPEVWMAWKVNGEGHIALDWTKDTAILVKMSGEKSVIAKKDGKLGVSLSPQPVYLMLP